MKPFLVALTLTAGLLGAGSVGAGPAAPGLGVEPVAASVQAFGGEPVAASVRTAEDEAPVRSFEVEAAVRSFEVEAVGQVPSGCATPAGKAPAVVSAQGAGRALLVDDRSASAHTVVTCPVDPRPSTSFRFSAYPTSLPNGFLITLLGGATQVYHLSVTSEGSFHWYDGSRWTQFAPPGTVRTGASNAVRIDADQQTAEVFVGETLVGTAYKAGAAASITAYQFASHGTVPQGDRVLFDDISTTAGRDFESEPVGGVPAGCITPAGKAAAVVAARTGSRSLRLNDPAANRQTVVSCPAVPQRGIDLRFAAYPAVLRNGFLVSLRGHFEGLADPRVVFHLAVVADGSLRWYDGFAWTTVSTPGAVRVGAWSSVQVRAAADQESVEILVNGVRAAAAGPIGMRRVVDVTGFELSSYGTATTGDDVYFDDLSVGAAPAVLPPGDVGVGPAVTVEQVTGSLLQMPHGSVTTGAETLVTYAAHADSSTGTGTRLATSPDSGVTWLRQDARNPMPDAQSYNLSRLRNGDLLAISYHTFMRPGQRSADVESTISRDGGRTWESIRVGTMTTPQPMRPISPHSSRPGRTLGGFVLVHAVVEDADGTLYQSAYGYFQGDPKYRQLMLRSTDGGLTWTTLSTVAVSPNHPGEGFSEAAIQRVADGSFLAVMRTGSYLPMYVSRSVDHGRTWSAPIPLRAANGLTITGVYPNLVPMPDGRLVLYYGRPGQSVSISNDGTGLSWTTPTTVDYRNSANGSAVPLDTNTLLTFGDRGADWSHNKPPTATIWSRTLTLPTR
ncbi:sialidase family protein [Kribbella sp. CA-247076]|uniref:sialidase family protein n=1 Tax=Kribbella sp. CA-247076 TaxID=3239941 RepID=UPI003D8F6445